MCASLPSPATMRNTCFREPQDTHSRTAIITCGLQTSLTIPQVAATATSAAIRSRLQTRSHRIAGACSMDAVYLQEAWPNLDQPEKRKIVECITNKIVIGRSEVEIDLCHLPSSKDMSKRDRSLRGSNPQPLP